MTVRDPCGYLCIFIMYLSIGYADYVLINWILLEIFGFSFWASIHGFLLNILILTLIVTHWKASFTDPGIIDKVKIREEFSNSNSQFTPSIEYRDWTICTQCETYRPPKAHHCRICRRCIRKMDHHCPWINNCVGECNQKFFLQFLSYVGIVSVYAILLIIYSWLSDCQQCTKVAAVRDLRILHSNILFMESILFGIFVILMLADQLSMIFHDTTSVEQLQNSTNLYLPYSRMSLLREICGRHIHPIFWLLPCSISNAKHLRKLHNPHYIV